ncbi:hypothetical protein AX16_010289 [Volvariella volvacea WC 439]|nr:hypothetical protein AX16_010289 [Volvariella volvacea WC 439]
MIKATGSVPPYQSSHRPSVTDLETIRKTSNRPLVIFPECTTSNGRGLLRFSNVFCQTVPVRNYRVFVMCVRYDPPTAIAPTLTLPIPCNTFSPLPHVWSLLSSLSPLSMSVRLLSPSDSPSSPLFTASDLVSGAPGEDQLAESCAALVAHIGKLKRIAMGWEDKTSFLRFYQGKQH